jgi:hypothetical protein
VAVQKYYYGQGEQETLDALNTMVESEGACVLRKLVDDPRAITRVDWEIGSYMLANFAVRTPAYIEQMQAFELQAITEVNDLAAKLRQAFDDRSRRGGKPCDFPHWEGDQTSSSCTLEQLNEYAARLRAEGGHRVSASSTFSVIPDIARCIQEMRFFLLQAPHGLFFVTCDSLLTLQKRRTGSRVGAGWKNRDALGRIALCPSHFLLMFYERPPGIQHRLATADEVLGLNLETISFADREVYSPFEHPEADDWMKGLGRWSRQEGSSA